MKMITNIKKLKNRRKIKYRMSMLFGIAAFAIFAVAIGTDLTFLWVGSILMTIMFTDELRDLRYFDLSIRITELSKRLKK